MPFRRSGEIARLWRELGLRDVEEGMLEVRSAYASFDELWSALQHAAGPIGAFMAQADAVRVQAIQAQCFALLGRPSAGFELRGKAAAARARV